MGIVFSLFFINPNQAKDRNLNKYIIFLFHKMSQSRFYLLSDLWSFMKERKKWWLLPIVIMLVLVGVLIVVGQSSALSPFIYALF